MQRNNLLERIFALRDHGTSARQELMAGLTTFVTMAYVVFVVPNMLANTGMDLGAVFVATCIGSAVACLLMGFYANWPVGLAPGIGLAAFFAYSVVGEMGYSWQVALGAVLIAGVLFVLMSLSRVRAWIMESIPLCLRYSMGAGVGLFLGLIGLKSAGIVVPSDATLLALGSLREPAALLALLCFLLIATLSHWRVFGAFLVSILVVTLIGLALGEVEYKGLVSAPPSLAPTWMAMDIRGALDLSMVSVILAFLFINIFDTAGTLMGVAHRAGLIEQDGSIEKLPRALKADSTSSVLGAFVGCPPVTSFVESASGVEAGGRTGLTAVTVGVLFLLCVFFSPLAGMIPAYATAGALIYVAMLMMGGMAQIRWDDLTDAIPAVVTMIMMPLTFSIANGIALGFLTYTALKLCTGQYRQVSLSLYILSAVFLAKFAFL